MSLAGIHAEFFERLNREIMGVAAESADGDLFAFEILGPFDIRLAENAVRQKVFYAADENQVGEALNVGAHIADRACDADLCVAVQRGGGGDRRRWNKNQPEVQVVFLKEPRLLSDPRHRLRHDLSRMKTGEPIGGGDPIKVKTTKENDKVAYR